MLRPVLGEEQYSLIEVPENGPFISKGSSRTQAESFECIKMDQKHTYLNQELASIR